MACYKVTVLGSKRTGKTALSHFLVTGSSLPQYNHTEEIDLRYVQFVHEDKNHTLGYPLGNCFLMIEDTPGWLAGDRKARQPSQTVHWSQKTPCPASGALFGPPPPHSPPMAVVLVGRIPGAVNERPDDVPLHRHRLQEGRFTPSPRRE
jgi:hypothetical protein